jgi:hypothetical protein
MQQSPRPLDLPTWYIACCRFFFTTSASLS